MILEIFPLGPADTNAILFGSSKEKKVVIIDPSQGSFEKISKYLEKEELTLEKILLTHSHWDHIVDAALFQKGFQVPICVHAEDAGNVENPGTDGLPLFFPIKGAKVDEYLEDGDRIRVGEFTLKVIHTPGHTPGCVCFYVEGADLLFSGDTLFKGSIGNLSFPTARPELMMASLEKLSKLPTRTIVYSGHGDLTTIGSEEKTFKYDWVGG